MIIWLAHALVEPALFDMTCLLQVNADQSLSVHITYIKPDLKQSELRCLEVL
jgi:hypothetical protein